jgi:hypothetical protein
MSNPLFKNLLVEFVGGERMTLHEAHIKTGLSYVEILDRCIDNRKFHMVTLKHCPNCNIPLPAGWKEIDGSTQ